MGLRETFVDLRAIFKALFYTKLHEEDTKLHKVILDKSCLVKHPFENNYAFLTKIINKERSSGRFS